MKNYMDMLKMLSNTDMTGEPGPEQVSKLLSNLDSSEVEKLKNILNDPVKTQQIINSPAAQALIKKLSGGK
jgi:hypothetical protein